MRRQAPQELAAGRASSTCMNVRAVVRLRPVAQHRRLDVVESSVGAARGRLAPRDPMRIMARILSRVRAFQPDRRRRRLQYLDLSAVRRACG